jgi:hypothetical protein
MQALLRKVKEGFEKNKEMFMFIKSERSSKVRARMQLVVGTRLQAQHPSFQLCILSNTPSVERSCK